MQELVFLLSVEVYNPNLPGTYFIGPYKGSSIL